MVENIMISFVVPVYNGSPMLEALCNRLVPIGESYGCYEIIFVDDGSRDNSCNMIMQLQQHFPKICLVELSRNFGQHNATMAGLAQARGEIIVTLDQDLQHPPEEINSLISKLNEGFDVVYGLPEKRAHNIYRNITSTFSKWISRKILSTALNGNFSSFRAIRGWVAAEIAQYNSSYSYLDGLISWTTANVGGVEVKNPKSDYESQYTFIRLVTHGINLVVNFSIRPLQAASVIGFISALVGLLVAIYILFSKVMFNTPVQGWTSLMVALLVIGGLQLTFLGLIGEYIGRILMNSNRAPNYIIRSVNREVSDHAK
jgi:undecaprenyl-phosphate 4-deoxy-4-formamido-L-arabinose transferase